MTLDDWMTEHGHTNEWLAAKVGITSMQIGRLRRRLRHPGPKTAERIFEVTGGEVTPNDFHDLPELDRASPSKKSSHATTRPSPKTRALNIRRGS